MKWSTSMAMCSALLFLCSVSPLQHSFINLMSTYLIGDVHGCYDELIALLKQVDFTPTGYSLADGRFSGAWAAGGFTLRKIAGRQCSHGAGQP